MDKKLLVLLLLFFLSFGIFTSVLIFNKPLTQFAKAKEESLPSADKSKIIAYPLYSLAANGTAESVISVFINSMTDKPLSNKSVTVTSSLGTVKPQSATTDEKGKAEFHLTSSVAGVAQLTVMVDNIKLNQPVSIKFE